MGLVGVVLVVVRAVLAVQTDFPRLFSTFGEKSLCSFPLKPSALHYNEVCFVFSVLENAGNSVRHRVDPATRRNSHNVCSGSPRWQLFLAGIKSYHTALLRYRIYQD